MCSANSEVISEVKEEIKTQEPLNVGSYFPAMIYTIEKPEFLINVKAVANEALKKIRDEKPKLNSIYPVRMTGNLWDDPRMSDFCQFTASTAWNILDSQGYNMSLFNTTFTELWCQEHHKHSAMDQHAHGGGVQLVGFYFLDTPKNSARPVIHDPRHGKEMINLPEKDTSQATPASNMINFEPKEGLLIFAPAWLQHSFTRHASSKPSKFIHFNISVIPAPQTVCVTTPPAEVV